MKIVKGNKTYPIIAGSDVIVTNESNTLKTVDEVLENQQKDIDRLKSNMKYIYSYGGVGGNGSGGSAAAGPEPSLLISLNGHKVYNEGDAIVLGEPGKYNFTVNLKNSGGKEYFIKVSIGGKAMTAPIALSTTRNGCTYTSWEPLQNNGAVIVEFLNPDGEQIDIIRKEYIVNPHIFNMKFMYKKGTSEGEFSSDNEYFIGDPDFTDPFINITYTINISNVQNIRFEYSVGDTDKTSNIQTSGQGTKEYGVTTNNLDNPFRIELSKLKRNGTDFLQDANTGNYTIKATMKYSVNGSEVTESKSFTITLIPNHLYINVRNPQGVIYNSLEELLDVMNISDNGIPVNSVSEGSYVSFYCKVYESSLGSIRWPYTLTCEVYDEAGESESELIFSDVPSNKDENNRLPSMTVDEQIESRTPFSIPFSSPGIKRIVFKTYDSKFAGVEGVSYMTEKYIFVKESTSELSWYPERTDLTFENKSYYFRANCGIDTYSEGFPRLQSATEPLELKISNTSSTVLSDSAWKTLPNGCDTTILSLGIQYSKINTDQNKILDVYSFLGDSDRFYDSPNITLYPDRIFTDTMGEIRIPNSPNYDKTKIDNYHLIQIARTKVEGENSWITYFYVDGIIESVKTSTDIVNWNIGKIVLNNVNIAYNLLNIQYVRKGEFTIDELIFQYWLKYKEKMKHIDSSPAEKCVLDSLSNHGIVFDGTSVVVDDGLVKTIAPKMPIPTLMVEYSVINAGEEVTEDNADIIQSRIDELERVLFMGYGNGDHGEGGFSQRPIKLHWCEAYNSNNESTLHEIKIPQMTNSQGGSLRGQWVLELQGTSTMKNRIKNFSLMIETSNSDDTRENILVSPNYNTNDPHTFLPEQIWTLKADIADSAHANNTSVGKFVNRTCSVFGTGQNFSTGSNTADFIKNTLEGFPVLMFFKIGNKVHYFGVYNFNMGRNSYYNLGYYSATDTENMRNTIPVDSPYHPFYFAKGKSNMVSDLAIGEVQDNFPQFDFHQYDRTLLFEPDSGTSITRMFGGASKITYGNTLAQAQFTLQEFVKSVAKAGAYCFARIGKNPVSSKADNGTGCVDRYTVVNQVPDVAWQLSYNGENEVWTQQTDITFDSMSANVNNLLQCISGYDLNGEKIGEAGTPFLDFTSASEYYTICMAFGLIDSVMKNMNIKSWDGRKCYIAFYDMDCALGEDNSGAEDVSYLAATDYWHSDSDGQGGPLKSNCTKDWDYWDPNVGKGFDCKSSYLYAIVKYAKALLGDSLPLKNYPQDFWVKLRLGELKSATYFVDNYFKSGIGTIPTYLASLNYQVKYMYNGKSWDENTGAETEAKLLANIGAFHGSRVEKVKDWLNKRLHFLDAMFNVQNVVIPIYGGINVPSADANNLNALKSNTDVVIMTDAFTDAVTGNTILKEMNNFLVDVYAPKHTPLVLVKGANASIYILPAETGQPNTLSLTYGTALASKFYGSKDLTDVSRIEAMLTDNYGIESDSLKRVHYSESGLKQINHNFTIKSTSVETIDMNIPNFNGELVIHTNDLYGGAVTSLNVSNSGFYGNWNGLGNLQYLNISSVNRPSNSIKVSNSPLLRGENCVISGTPDKPTSLQALQLSTIYGVFQLENTAIQTITMSAKDGENAEFVISNDEKLTNLSLTGFRRVVITGCPKLSSLTITDTDSNKCEEISIDIPVKTDDSEPELKGINGRTDGVFDFQSYTKLQTLSMTGCEGAEIIKIPNRKVQVTSLQNNVNLEFIDTCGKISVIELINDGTFKQCPRYYMHQSWSKNGSENPQRTKMCISPECTSLAHTFNRVLNYPSKYTNTPYRNEYGQNIINHPIYSDDAVWFLNTVVANVQQDDEYILKKERDDTYVLTDTDYLLKQDQDYKYIVKNPTRGLGNGTAFGTENCCLKITSLMSCFRMQTGIAYDGADSNQKMPNLKDYTSLIDISAMYNGTNVTFIDTKVLSLPKSLNNNNTQLLTWKEIITSREIHMTKDALKNVSYRSKEMSAMILTICGDGGYYDIVTDPIDMVDVLSPKEYIDENGEAGVDYVTINGVNYIPFTRLDTFNAFNINAIQTVDYSKMFELCPNVKNLSTFLSCDLTNATITDMLHGCTNLTSISDSFNHTGDVDSLPYTIDLYTFFNWGKNLNMTALFSSSNSNNPGFCVKKTISQEHFKEIIENIHEYDKIEKLSNIFSYCTITDCDSNYEIKPSEVMSNVKQVDSLFYHCKGVSGMNDAPLNIRRSFFEKLPNVISMANTFSGVHFAKMLTYDFFCKRKNQTVSNVYLGPSDSAPRATVQTHNYGDSVRRIVNMINCFRDAKFVGCKSWFDIDDRDNNELQPPLDRIVPTDTDDPNIYTTYYTKTGGIFVQTDITEPVEIADTRNNFTNYVDNIQINASQDASSDGVFRIDNHNILKDLRVFGNGNDVDGDDCVYKQNKFNIYPVHCCLPPDIFYACSSNCKLSGVFANTNIIGVLPQHLISKCNEGDLNDMLLNTNILPNVVYHYNKDTANDPNYIEMILNVPVDEDMINTTYPDYTTTFTFDESSDSDDFDATVLFRDAEGTLKRRRPRNGDARSSTKDENAEYSLSQFVYVPLGFTKNINLTRAFNFRYNLPKQIDLVSAELRLKGINWASGSYSFGEASPEIRPYSWPYYTQYFLLADESVSWTGLSEMRFPFIGDGDDIDYETNIVRQFNVGSDSVQANTWYSRSGSFNKDNWNNRTNGVFNSFLNMCGKRDVRTGVFTDNGCSISKAIGYPKLDGLASGLLTTFLNGRVLDAGVDAGRLTSLNVIGEKIVVFMGFGRNIILPTINSLIEPEKIDSKPVLNYNQENSQFYAFMFDNQQVQKKYVDRYKISPNICTDIGTYDHSIPIVRYKVL